MFSIAERRFESVNFVEILLRLKLNGYLRVAALCTWHWILLEALNKSAQPLQVTQIFYIWLSNLKPKICF